MSDILPAQDLGEVALAHADTLGGFGLVEACSIMICMKPITRSALRAWTLALGTPMSANTLPLMVVILVVLLLPVRLGVLKASGALIHVGLQSNDALLNRYWPLLRALVHLLDQRQPVVVLRRTDGAPRKVEFGIELVHYG